MQSKHLQIIFLTPFLLLLGCIDNKPKTVYTDNISEMFSNEKLIIASQLQNRRQLDTVLAGYILGSSKLEVEKHESDLFKSKLIIKSDLDTLLNIPNLINLKISKDFVSDKLCQIWFIHYLIGKVDFYNNDDRTWPIYRDLESFLYQKYQDFNIYYCPQDQKETWTLWIKGDLSIGLYRHYRENVKVQGRISDGLIMIRYYKNSLIEAKKNIESENQRKHQEESNKKEKIRMDSISKYF